MREHIAEQFFGEDKYKEEIERMRKCNHRHENGSSALVCGGGMNSCTICGWDDW